MWKVYRRRGYVGIRSDDVYAVVDPSEVPEDVIDVDFVILTEKPKSTKVIEDILRSSKATLVGTSKNVKKYSVKYYVDEVSKVKGLAPGLWVGLLGGSVVIGVDSEEGYALIVSQPSQTKEAEELGLQIYGEKGKILIKKDIEEEEI